MKNEAVQQKKKQKYQSDNVINEMSEENNDTSMSINNTSKNFMQQLEMLNHNPPDLNKKA